MTELNTVAVENSARVAELAILVDLEARWENLRIYPSGTPEAASTVQDLHSKQRAYDLFHSKLVAFNKRYSPAHVPELLLNTPARLGLWCRRMRDLYARVENESGMQCPVHLVEKAYRWADRVAAKKNREPVTRPAPSRTIAAAIAELDVLGRWCDELAQLEAAA